MEVDIGQIAAAWFDFVRNKMFYVDVNYFCLEEMLKNALLTDRASCLSKHVLLGGNLSVLGCDVNYLLFPFRWADLPVDYPRKLIELAIQLPETRHLAITVKQSSQVRFLDATWDPPLGSAGFHVNSCSDAILENAVVPCGEPMEFTDVDSLLVARRKRFTKRSSKENALFLEFYPVLNDWLDSVRASFKSSG